MEGMSSTMNLKMTDEAMIAWKSRLIVEIYMRDKPNRCSIKAHLVSESKSGCALNMEVYTGKTLPVKYLGLELLGSLLLNKRYHSHSPRKMTVTVLN
jgi:hypothetical protein